MSLIDKLGYLFAISVLGFFSIAYVLQSEYFYYFAIVFLIFEYIFFVFIPIFRRIKEGIKIYWM